MTARKITAKDGQDAITMLDREKAIKATQDTTRKAAKAALHLDPTTGATVLTPKVKAVKKTALRDDKLSLRVVKTAPVKVTKSSLVRAEFEKGASLTEASKATGVDPAFVWDLASAWQKKTGRMVPRSGRAPKVVAVKKTPVKKTATVRATPAQDRKAAEIKRMDDAIAKASAGATLPKVTMGDAIAKASAVATEQADAS